MAVQKGSPDDTKCTRAPGPRRPVCSSGRQRAQTALLPSPHAAIVQFLSPAHPSEGPGRPAGRSRATEPPTGARHPTAGGTFTDPRDGTVSPRQAPDRTSNVHRPARRNRPPAPGTRPPHGRRTHPTPEAVRNPPGSMARFRPRDGKRIGTRTGEWEGDLHPLSGLDASGHTVYFSKLGPKWRMTAAGAVR